MRKSLTSLKTDPGEQSVFNVMGISKLDLGVLFEKLSECYNFRSASGYVMQGIAVQGTDRKSVV